MILEHRRLQRERQHRLLAEAASKPTHVTQGCQTEVFIVEVFPSKAVQAMPTEKSDATQTYIRKKELGM